jgi:hypothetical protein
MQRHEDLMMQKKVCDEAQESGISVFRLQFWTLSTVNGKLLF